MVAQIKSLIKNAGSLWGLPLHRSGPGKLPATGGSAQQTGHPLWHWGAGSLPLLLPHAARRRRGSQPTDLPEGTRASGQHPWLNPAAPHLYAVLDKIVSSEPAPQECPADDKVDVRACEVMGASLQSYPSSPVAGMLCMPSPAHMVQESLRESVGSCLQGRNLESSAELVATTRKFMGIYNWGHS